MEEKEYINFNVSEIKRMLKELLKLDYSKLSLTDSITLEHRVILRYLCRMGKIIGRR